MDEKIYKYRMDYIYQLLVIYLVFFVLYAVIKGKFFEEKFTLVFNDPIIYILILFICLFLIIVIVNLIRGRQIIIKNDRVVFRNRFGSREVMFNEILNVKIGRRRSPGDGKMRIIKIKLKNRRRLLRLRANDFERGGELIREFLKVKI
jgi:hypothetical protein